MKRLRRGGVKRRWSKEEGRQEGVREDGSGGGGVGVSEGKLAVLSTN